MNFLVIAGMAVIGAVVGPFLRAEIVRNSVPVGRPQAQACAHCGAPLARATALPRTPLPVSGRCRTCANRLGPPAGSVELVTASVLALLAWRLTEPLTLLALSWAALVGVVLSFIDVGVHRLPNRLVLIGLAGTATTLTFAAVVRHHDMSRLAVAGLCALGSVVAYLLLALLPAGYGLGDAKAAAITGLTAGWFGIGAAIGAMVGGLVLGGVAAAVVLLARPGSASRSIVHGPFMFAGALLAVLAASR